MVVALVVLVVILALSAILLHAAASLSRRSFTVSYQNTQCELAAEAVADELIDALEDGSHELTKSIFTEIDWERSWHDYDPNETSKDSIHSAEKAMRTYQIGFSGENGAGTGALNGMFQISVTLYWEASEPGVAYLNGDYRELVARIVCTNAEGGYYAVLLRFGNSVIKLQGKDYWGGTWNFLWKESVQR